MAGAQTVERGRRRDRGRLRGSWEGAVAHAGWLSFKFPSAWDEKFRGMGAF